MAKTRLEIRGMSCQHCVKTVTDALTTLEGVQRVKVNLRKGEVIVRYDASYITDANLAKAITEVGFEMVTNSKPLSLRLIGSILITLLSIAGCSDMPYTGSMLTAEDVDRYVTIGEGSACLLSGDESACITLIPETEDDSRPVIYIHPRKLIYVFYYKGVQIMRAEIVTDTTEIMEQVRGLGEDDQPPSGDGGVRDDSSDDDGDDIINGGGAIQQPGDGSTQKPDGGTQQPGDGSIPRSDGGNGGTQQPPPPSNGGNQNGGGNNGQGNNGQGNNGQGNNGQGNNGQGNNGQGNNGQGNNGQGNNGQGNNGQGNNGQGNNGQGNNGQGNNGQGNNGQGNNGQGNNGQGNNGQQNNGQGNNGQGNNGQGNNGQGNNGGQNGRNITIRVKGGSEGLFGTGDLIDLRLRTGPHDAFSCPTGLQSLTVTAYTDTGLNQVRDHQHWAACKDNTDNVITIFLYMHPALTCDVGPNTHYLKIQGVTGPIIITEFDQDTQENCP